MAKQKIKRCYICKQYIDPSVKSRIKVGGKFVYVHRDECLKVAKQAVRMINQYTNKIKRMMVSCITQAARKWGAK